MDDKPRYRRRQDAITIKAKTLTDQVMKKIYKDYDETSHAPPSKADAFDTITDFCIIEEAIQRILTRHNANSA